MFTKFLILLQDHSVAIAILIANIVNPVIISQKASRDLRRHNKYQYSKDALLILLQVQQELASMQQNKPVMLNEGTSVRNLNCFKKNSAKIILNCQKALHLIARAKMPALQTQAACKDIYVLLSSTQITKLESSQRAEFFSKLYAQLNQSIEEEWIFI